MTVSDSRPTAVPTWFGPASAPMFGVLHVPAGGQARGGVLICPPLGKEHVDTYRGLKLLAQTLAARGFAVLRFDYLGTGDSDRPQGSDSAVEDLSTSIQRAADYLRTTGVRSVAAVGVRAGALLLSAMATEVGIDRAVLWDPVTDGRRYLRQQRILYRMTVGDDEIDVVGQNILGITFSTAGAAALAALRLPDRMDCPTLVLSRPEHRDDKALVAIAAGPGCASATCEDQAAFVEPLSFVVAIPEPTIQTITTWLADSTPDQRVPVSAVHRDTAMVAGADGRPVLETIEHLGPDRLFAIRTSPAAGSSASAALLIHNTAAEHRVGSGRIWVESARDLAAIGLTVLRYDRRGTGDTGIATTAFPRIQSAASKTDALTAAAATGAPADRVMMTGICSGAWHSAHTAIESGARAVVLANIIVYSTRRVEVGPERLDGLGPQTTGGPPPPEPRTAKGQLKRLVRRWLPHPAWLALGHLGVIQAPQVLLKKLRRNRVGVHVVLAPGDYEFFANQRGQRGVDTLRQADWSPSVLPAPSGDHPLLQRDIQNVVRQKLIEVARQEFGDDLPASARGASAAAAGSTG